MPNYTFFKVFILLAYLARFANSVSGEDQIQFGRDIRPILSDRCFPCHGPDESHREADLRFDIEDRAKDDLGGYWAIVPGEADESELVKRISTDDEDLRMPPADVGQPLATEDIDLLRRWIEEGAVWSRHWAYEPPRRRAVPPVKDETWPANWIDHFILARLESEGLRASPEADRVTLVRRLYFDLIGLPPHPDRVDRFVDSTDPEAYEQLVDQLLASEHFGERMAMVWLDLVRYADTVGYHGDQDHNISPYRDYVIDAFNDNLPFDQFTREQLAGDLIANCSIDQKIASGYNRLLQTSHEGGVQPREYLAIYAADRVRNFSAVWMGATLGCAQCHNHKFDPYTMRDFYTMAAFFADLDEAQHFKVGSNALPTRRPPEIQVLTRRERKQLADLERQVADLRALVVAANGDQTEQKDKWTKQIEKLNDRSDAIRKNARTTMISVAIKPRAIRVLPRGNWLDDSGPIVQPAVPEFLGVADAESQPATRLDLANWLTTREAGVGLLTARVFVNRFWYLLMGGGLAANLDDFGGQGQPPTHPELLDQLAMDFFDNGWDVKQMLKLIVMSRTYRQSSLESKELRERDPYNRLFARQARYRLPAEMVRDNALAVSGLLVRDVGGGSVKPYQPAGYYRHLNFPTRKYAHHTDDRQWRRGVYMHWQRQFLHPMLKAMDAPRREECTAQRPRSNTPLAALTLLNDPTFIEAARVFAGRIVREGGESNRDRMDFAFRTALSREPDQYERHVLARLLQANWKHYHADPDAARQINRVGLAPVPDTEEPAELAAWTAIARTVLNLSETTTRN
jgi:hypothetical protein